MTERIPLYRKKSRKSRLTAGQICFGWFSVFCLFLILRNTEIAMEYMTQGLRLCVKTVIPSLFPFMVISELVVSCGIGSAVIRPFSSFFKKIFRLPEAGCCAVLLGMFCGFPVGVKCAVGALKSQQISREEAQRVLLFSTNPSSAFLINAVGVSLWGNKRFGVLLYGTVLLSQLAVGLLFTHVFQSKDSESESPLSSNGLSKNDLKGVNLFTQAVSSSCFGILLICAYVVFFSTLVGTLNLILQRFNVSVTAKALVFGLFELSGGMNAAAALSVPTVAALLSAFAAGWSGFSFHCQLLALCDGHKLKLRSYFFAKLLQGVLCVLLFWLLIRLNPSILIPAEPC